MPVKHWWAVLTSAVMLLGAPTGAAEKAAYKAITYGGNSGTINAQMHTVLSDIAEQHEKETGTLWDRSFTDNFKLFVEQLENESVQLAYSFDQEHLNTALNHGFTPLVSFEMFGREAFKGCFYVHKDSPIKTMKDIRGKRAVVYSTPFPYYLLRDFLEEDPAAYFSKLTPSPDGQSILMAVAMGVEEVGFAKEQNYFFLKILDGGTYSKLRKVGCTGRDFINAPLLVHRSLPKEVIKDVRSYLMHLTKNKDLLQKYRGMATMTKFKVIPAKPEHLADYHAVMDRVETEGWKKDYLLWLSGQQAK